MKCLGGRYCRNNQGLKYLNTAIGACRSEIGLIWKVERPSYFEKEATFLSRHLTIGWLAIKTNYQNFPDLKPFFIEYWTSNNQCVFVKFKAEAISLLLLIWWSPIIQHWVLQMLEMKEYVHRAWAQFFRGWHYKWSLSRIFWQLLLSFGHNGCTINLVHSTPWT